MKVLLISPFPPPNGGIATVTLNIVTYFKTNPPDIDLIAFNTSHQYRSITSDSFIVKLLTGLCNSTNTYCKVKKIIKEAKPNIIHLSSSSSFALIKDWMIINIARRFNIPIVMHWHFGRIPNLIRKQNWEWKLFFYLIHKSAWSIVIDKRTYYALSKIRLQNISYIPNPLGVHLEQKTKDIMVRRKAKRQQGRIIFVGHVIKNKGVFDLVEACSQLPSIKELLLIGPVEEIVKKRLLGLAIKRENGTWLKLTGSLDKEDVLDLMKTSPILALPSYTEGFPMVVLEAMAMGCSVIATDVGDIPEMLASTTESPCGIVCPIQDIERLKDAILSLVANPSKAEIMGQNGINRVLNYYKTERIVEQYKLLWQNVAEGKNSISLKYK